MAEGWQMLMSSSRGTETQMRVCRVWKELYAAWYVCAAGGWKATDTGRPIEAAYEDDTQGQQQPTVTVAGVRLWTVD